MVKSLVERLYQYIKKTEYYKMPFRGQQDLEVLLYNMDVTKTNIRMRVQPKWNNKMLRMCIKQTMEEENITEADAQLVFLLTLPDTNQKGKGSKLRVAFAKKMISDERLRDKLLYIANGYFKDYMNNVYVEAFSWQKRRGKGAMDTRLPEGNVAYLDDYYRVFENGVVQSCRTNRDYSLWTNLTGCSADGKIHFNKVETEFGVVTDLFLTADELVAAYFIDDPWDDDYVVYRKDPNISAHKNNLYYDKYDKNKVNYGNTRIKIYNTKAFGIVKVRGKSKRNKTIKVRITQEKTNDWLRSLKKRKNPEDFSLIMRGKIPGIMLTEKAKNEQDVEEVLSMKCFVNKNGTFSTNQGKFNIAVNNAYENYLKKTFKARRGNVLSL